MSSAPSVCGCGDASSVENSRMEFDDLLARLYSARACPGPAVDDIAIECCLTLADADPSGSQAVLTVAAHFQQHEDSEGLLDALVALCAWRCRGKLLAFALDDVAGDVSALARSLRDAAGLAARVNARADFYQTFPGHEPLPRMAQRGLPTRRVDSEAVHGA